MKEELIKYQTALLAKKKGFDEECNHVFSHTSGCDYLDELAYYESGGEVKNSEIANAYFSIENVVCTAPSQSLLQRWLRETHKINVCIAFYPNTNRDFNPLINDYYYCKVHENEILRIEDLSSDTYECTLEEALKEALNLII